MTDIQLRYINKLTVFVRKLLKLVPRDQREELEDEFDSILLEVMEPIETNRQRTNYFRCKAFIGKGSAPFSFLE